MGLGEIILLVLIVVIILVIVTGIRIVPQSYVMIVERLGTYKATWNTGVHFRVPLIDRVTKKISLKEQLADFNPQDVITRDNVTMQIDTVIYYQVTDPALYTYGIEDPIKAIDNLSATTLRNIIGDLELDETLTSRDLINSQMRRILDEATDPWGIKVNRVELKNIVPPRDVQAAMEKQVKAEREKRASILTAEGEKESAILRAEGNKESAILKADANKEAQVRIAEGEAQAILKVFEAKARGIELLRTANADDKVLSLRALQALEKVADGRATKILIPSDLANFSGLVQAAKTIAQTEDPKDPDYDKGKDKEKTTTVEDILKASLDNSDIPNVALDMQDKPHDKDDNK